VEEGLGLVAAGHGRGCRGGERLCVTWCVLTDECRAS
jgi:hypothetical protein